MPNVLVRDGKDPLTSPILQYLIGLGIDQTDIVRVLLDSQFGMVQTVTVTLMVRDDHV